MADGVTGRERDVDPRLTGPAAELRRQGERRLAQRHPVGDRLPLLLDGLGAQPVRADVVRGLRALVAEDMGVAADQLVDEGGHDVVDGERLVRVLLGDPGVEDHLEQDVPELLAQLLAITGLDGLHQLVGLLDRVPGEAPVGLLRGPRALQPDPVHDLDQVQEPGARQVVRAGQQLQVRHLHPARAPEPGQAVGERPVSLAAHQHHHGPAARAVVHQLLGRRHQVFDAHTRLTQVRQLRVVRLGAQHPVGGVQRLPGGPGQQSGGDPVACGEQDDTAGSFSVHTPNLPRPGGRAPRVPGQAPASGSCCPKVVTWVIHGAS